MACTGDRIPTTCPRRAAVLAECARELHEILEAMADTERELLEMQAAISAKGERPVRDAKGPFRGV
jgi:hypothetical protein